MDRIWKGVTSGIVAVFLTVGGHEAFAYGRTDLTHLHPGDPDRPPIGWVLFCELHPNECVAPGRQDSSVRLTEERLQDLHSVNRYFNQRIRPMTDYDQYGVVEKWTYADTGSGDCEDYVLEKRRRLTQLGWPQRSLLITVVINKQGEGHAVLTVTTERGHFILDNLTDDILLWSDTGLIFVKRQAESDPNQWVDLGRLIGRRESLTAATPR